MQNKIISEIKCMVCEGTHFRKGNFEAVYEKYDEVLKFNENADAGVRLNLDSEEENPLQRVPDKMKFYSYICEDCGFIMNFIQEKRVESKKKERMRKQREKMYDWTHLKNKSSRI